MDRERRRHLASYHQQRQIRLEQTLSWKRTQRYDPERKVQSDRGKKARFLAYLKGKVYSPSDVGLWYYTSPPDPKRIGRLKKLSWDDCGRSACRMCSNPRHNKWSKRSQSLTLQEHRADDSWKAQLETLTTESD